jgi:UDP-N-acetylglucosamine--N-acetylmuramyl-(pentapeptide) pyrophosphoryl-undecaprenol N-acetylglucosamine transferase
LRRETDRRIGGVRILIACGGSGGHIFPAVALAQGIKDKDKDASLLFVGSKSALDRRIFEKEGFSYKLLSSNKLSYKKSVKTAVFFIKLFLDTLKSLWIVMRYSPDVVVGFGGYVSSPVVLAAYVLKIPRVVHEQNVVPGRANNLLFRFADSIAISFKETKKYMGRYAYKAVVTGNPIRVKLLKDDRQTNVKKMGLYQDRFTILVIGGSQGAHNLNKAFLQALTKLDASSRMKLQVIHITGIADYGWAEQAYQELGLPSKIFSFIDNIDEAYSASDLVVTRSGASAIFEIAYFGRPMILIPYPFAMSHQAENAKVFSSNGAAIQIDEKEMSADLIKRKVEELLSNKPMLDEMSKRAKALSVPDSSHNLAIEILNTAKGPKK